MRWMRSTWGARLMAAGLVACLLSSVVATGAMGQRRAVGLSYADWVRAQLRVPADDALEAALSEAVSSHPRTLDAFLATFIEAYESRQPQAPLSVAFLSRDLSNDALISYLETRYHGVVGEGMLPRTFFTSALVPFTKAPDRPAMMADVLARHVLDAPLTGEALRPEARYRPAGPVRLLSSAQPLGP